MPKLSAYQPPCPTLSSTRALLHLLQSLQIKFLRFVSLDMYNNPRSKLIPLSRLTPHNLNDVVNLSAVVVGGLPSYADVPVAGSGLDARGNLVLHPDLSSLRVMPYARGHAWVMCTVHDQVNGGISQYCGRGLLSRVVRMAEECFGLAFDVGAEIEFCLFKDEGGQQPEAVDSSLFAYMTTIDDHCEFLNILYDSLQKQNVNVETLHAESAGGQLEIVLAHTDDIMKIADDIVLTKETIKACAKDHGMRALFLPKVNPMQAGNGLHLHFSFRDLKSTHPAKNAIPDDNNPLQMSPMAQSFLEGLLVHLPALLGLTIPSINSFRRMGPGCWTGYSQSWAIEDKEAPLRVCRSNGSRGELSNIEMKLCDSTANGYMAIAAIIAAGLDGVEKTLVLRRESDESGGPLPKNLGEALDHLERDECLLEILGDNMAKAYLAVRRAEVDHDKDLTLDEEILTAYKMS